MKRKYYLRGIGVGILFTAIVWLTTLLVSGKPEMTDEEVIARAQELGMVKQESVLEQLEKPSDTETEETDTEETDTEQTASADNSTDVAADNPTESESVSGTEASTGETTEESKETVVTFTIVSGMNSWNVATLLQDQGVVNASEFDQYLEQNGYSSRIVTGEYSVAVGTDYETIARMITGKQ